MTKLSMGEFLTVLRKGQGYTQEEIAEKLGVSSKTVSSWENGRTYPDIMMLPIIADIYNITVDELVRGERNNNKEISVSEIKQNEKSLLKIRKLKYVKYKERRLIFTISAIVSSLLSILGLYLMTFVKTWTLVFAVIGFLSLITFIVFLIINEKTYLRNEGLLLDDDITEKTYPFLLSIKMNTLFSLLFSLISYFIYGIVFVIIYAINNNAFKYTLLGTVEVDNTSLVLTIAIISIVLGLGGILSFFILKSIYINKYGNENQKKNKKHNIKLSIIIFLIIPASLLLFNLGGIITELFFGETIVNYNVSYLSSSLEEFKNKMVTYTIRDKNLIDAGLKEGDEYIFKLPNYDELDEYNVYDCENGFVYFNDFRVPLNTVDIYTDYDEEMEDYSYSSEISDVLYYEYVESKNKNNIVYSYRKGNKMIEINMPNEMFIKKYNEEYDIYYLEFKEGTYYANDHKIVVSTDKYNNMVYSDFYYRKSNTDMIEEYIEITYTGIEYIEVCDLDSNDEIIFESIPTLTSEVYLEEDETLYDILGYGVYSHTNDGYIFYKPDTGKYGHYNIAFYFPIDFTYTLTPYIFLYELILCSILLLIISKKQKYTFEFDF